MQLIADLGEGKSFYADEAANFSKERHQHINLRFFSAYCRENNKLFAKTV